jgi:hypothetical protein
VKPRFCSAVWLRDLGPQRGSVCSAFQFNLISIEFQAGCISLTRALQTGSALPSNSLDSVIEIKAEFQRGESSASSSAEFDWQVTSGALARRVIFLQLLVPVGMGYIKRGC